MSVEPVNLPSSAGIDYGHGDVRHFSPGDEMSVPSLQNPTRHLAERDNKLAEKLNEVIGVVNNQEQFVPLPLIRTLLSPGEEAIVANYRIPSGFECRILNAAIAATPTSTDIELNVYYNTTFGGVAGKSVISTANEYSGGVSFYQVGEFVVGLKNKGDISLELAASIMMTVRPLGAEGSLLIASTIKGDRGDPGPTGPQGLKGDPGSGGVGSPGMIWAGSWSAAHPHDYSDKDVVYYNLYGSLPSSFICAVPASSRTTTPQASYVGNLGVWDPVAIGSAGPIGASGPTGAAGGAPLLGAQTVQGTFVTGADYVAGDTWEDYLGAGAASSRYAISMSETYVEDATTHAGLAFLFHTVTRVFKGHGTIELPTQSAGYSKANYNNNQVQCIVADAGTGVNYNGTCWSIIRSESTAHFVVLINGDYPRAVSITVTGAANYT